MDITKLDTLKKRLLIRSSLLALDSIEELLSLSDNLSSDEVFLEIIKKALREFELSCPLILEMPMCLEQMGTCFGRNGWYEVKSNFTLWLDCLIDEAQIILVPNSIPQIRYSIGGVSFPTAGSYDYVTEYNRPYVFLGDQMYYNQFFMKGICSRPIIPDFLPDKTFNTKSQKAAIYWLNIEEGARGNYFMDLCMCHLLDYIRQLKASIQLPSMNVDVLANVDPAYQELRSKCDNYNLQSSWYGELLY